VTKVISNQWLVLKESEIFDKNEVHNSSIVWLLVDCLVADKGIQGFDCYLPDQEQNVPVDKM